MSRTLVLLLLLIFAACAPAASTPTAGTPATSVPAAGTPVTSALAVAQTPPAQGANAELRREIEELNRRMVETMKKGDLMGVAAFYADDATIYFSRDQRTHGRRAIDAYWSGLKGGKEWVLEVREVGGSKDAVYQLGRSTFTTEVDGKQSVYACDILVIWKRQKDGQLKIHADFFN